MESKRRAIARQQMSAPVVSSLTFNLAEQSSGDEGPRRQQQRGNLDQRGCPEDHHVALQLLSRIGDEITGFADDNVDAGGFPRSRNSHEPPCREPIPHE